MNRSGPAGRTTVLTAVAVSAVAVSAVLVVSPAACGSPAPASRAAVPPVVATRSTGSAVRHPSAGAGAGTLPTLADGRGTGTARILLAGDVMLGRGVARRTAGDPSAALAGVRDVVRAADLAAANLESPLTDRPHRASAGPYPLEAAPSAAALLADAGFDVLAVANNHAGDAGPQTVADTVTALAGAGLAAVGGGRVADAFTARIVTVRGIRIAWLAVDATGAGPRAGPDVPGVAWWDEARLADSVRAARRAADVVVVGLHGGTEYRNGADRAQAAHAATLAGLGVDVVWGHHAHVAQPVSTIDPDGDGRPTIVATSLGNLLFDQHEPATARGLVLELLAGRDGVRAVRRGEVQIAEGRAWFARWLAPDAGSGAVLLRGSWWQLTPVAPRPATSRPDVATSRALAAVLSPAQVLDSTVGDVTGDGSADVVAAFRRPFRLTEVGRTLPRERLVDSRGRSVHVGVYRRGDLSQLWVAGSVTEPVSRVAACDGWLAVGLTRLDDVTAATGVAAWRWGGFGFVTYPGLSGPGRPACADVDGDGSRDPLALERTAP